MTDEQGAYLTEQFNAITAAIFSGDCLSRDWENYIDLESWARHYVVQEIMRNYDAYTGSCYLYKDYNGKWTFGPLWDLGDSFDEISDDFVINSSTRRQTWIKETVKYPRFMKKVQEVWAEFMEIDPVLWENFLIRWDDMIYQAEEQNRKVWPYYPANDTHSRREVTSESLKNNMAFLDGRWGGEPLTYNVAVSEAAHGKLLPGGHDFTDVDVFKGADLQLEVVLDEDETLASITINGEKADIVPDENGMIILENICEDMSLDVDITSGVESVVVDSLSAETEYFSVDGRKVSQPGKGIYIRRSGSIVQKVVCVD